MKHPYHERKRREAEMACDALKRTVVSLMADIEALTRDRDEARDNALYNVGQLGAMRAERDAARARELDNTERLLLLSEILEECLPLVVWHETSGMDGATVAPGRDLSKRIVAARLSLELRDEAGA